MVGIASWSLKVDGRDEVIWMFGIMVNDVCTLFSGFMAGGCCRGTD